jgi:HEAT repeat protein
MDYTDINQCIQTLNEKPRWFFQKDNIAEKMQCFDTIQKVGTPTTIYSLISFLKSDNSLIQEKSAETILHLFAKLKSQNDYADSLKHLSIDKSDLDLYRVDFDEKTYLQLLGIASLNSSGYVREKAVKEIARLKNTNGINFILFRLSDWVLPVRKAATEAINSFLDKVYIDQLLKELSTIDWLLNVKRVDLTETHSRIIQFILNQGFSEEFYNKINRLDDKTRLRYFRNFFKHKKPSKEQINSIVKDKNFLIRLEVLKYLSTFDTTFQEELIGDFLQDQSARIRVNALYATKPYNPNFDKKINILLSDDSASVRELCRHLLKPKNVDFAEIYRERIKKEEFLSGTLIGLSEVGTIEDLPIFERYISSKKSKIIIGCLTAINKLNPDTAKYYSLELLTHSIKRVRNKAAEILAKGCDNDTLQKVRQKYLVGDYEIKKTVLKLYNKIGGWNVIGDFLIALTDDNSNIQNIGWQLLDKWKANATRLFTTPPKAEIERANDIYKSLDRSKTKLTHSRTNLLQDLQFYLR